MNLIITKWLLVYVLENKHSFYVIHFYSFTNSVASNQPGLESFRPRYSLFKVRETWDGPGTGVSCIMRLKLSFRWQSGSLVRFGDSCISLLGNLVLACISIVGVKKLPMFLHKTISIWPTDQMYQKLKSPSVSFCLPT